MERISMFSNIPHLASLQKWRGYQIVFHTWPAYRNGEGIKQWSPTLHTWPAYRNREEIKVFSTIPHLVSLQKWRGYQCSTPDQLTEMEKVWSSAGCLSTLPHPPPPPPPLSPASLQKGRGYKTAFVIFQHLASTLITVRAVSTWRIYLSIASGLPPVRQREVEDCSPLSPVTCIYWLNFDTLMATPWDVYFIWLVQQLVPEVAKFRKFW